MTMKEYIRVKDGTGTKSETSFWGTTDIRKGEKLMSDLISISQKLLDRNPTKANQAIKIRVERFKGEWLYFDHIFTDTSFLHEIFFKIDDDLISIYPSDWVRHSRSLKALGD